MRTAIFVGSFDPFTIGHQAIVKRALPLFDKLIIGVGVNEQKHYMQSAEERREAIERLFADEKRVEVKTYKDFTVDFARREGAQFIVKGVRNIIDFEHEREQADINRELSGVETILLIAEPSLANVSSSLVREMQHFGKPIDKYIPKP